MKIVISLLVAFLVSGVIFVTSVSADNNCKNQQKGNGGSVNNNCNNNSNWQSQSQTQNNNQSVNISMPAVQSVVTTTTLPKTGPQDSLWLTFLAAPVGYILRKKA